MLVAVLAAQEAIFRYVFPSPEFASFNRVHYGPRPRWVRGPLRENVNSRYLYLSKPDGAQSINSLNVYGFRDPEDWPVQKPLDRTRVMFIGDSFVEGLLTDDQHTIPAVFAKEAERGSSRLEVMNLGVSGAGVEDYAAMLRDAVPVFKPDVVVIVFYENDFPNPATLPWLVQPHKTPHLTSWWTPRLVTLVQRALAGRVLARRRPGPISPVYFPVPDPGNPLSDPGLRARTERFVDPSLLSQMVGGTLSPWLLDHLLHSEQSLRVPIEAREPLRELKQFVEKQGVKRLLLAYIPPAVQVSDHYVPFAERISQLKQPNSLQGPEYRLHGPALARASTELGIPFIDLSEHLRDEEARGTRLYWDYDTHMRSGGYALVARDLWRLFCAQP